MSVKRRTALAKISGERYAAAGRSSEEGMSIMGTAVHAVAGSKAGKKLFNEKSGAPMTKTMTKNNHGYGFNVLTTPTALRVQLTGLVVLALVAGRLFPDFGRLLQQFSALLFR
jgi:hypothetical protein